MNKKAFGNRLRQARTEQNFTADMLAETCNINAVFLRQIECGIKLPSLPNLVVLCNALQVSPAFLMRDSLNVAENKSMDITIEKLKTLSPKQLEVVWPTIQAMIEHID